MGRHNPVESPRPDDVMTVMTRPDDQGPQRRIRVVVTGRSWRAGKFGGRIHLVLVADDNGEERIFDLAWWRTYAAKPKPEGGNHV